jgi:hypothetical protein
MPNQQLTLFADILPVAAGRGAWTHNTGRAEIG